MHKRSQIRDRVVGLLLGQQPWGNSVYKNRARPLVDVDGWASELPALIVYTRNESSDEYTQAPLTFERRLNVVVEIHCAASTVDGYLEEDVDDLLDDLSERVEQLVGRYDWHLDEVRFGMTGTDMGFSDKESARLVGVCAISFQMTYYQEAPDSGKSESLDDFVRAENTFQVGTALNHQTVTLP